MIRVHRGRGGWVSSGPKLARSIALISLGVTLALSGCSSKKAKGVGDVPPGGNPSGMGETTSTDSSLNQFQKGMLGSGQGGPLTDIHFGYNEYTIEPQDGSILKSNASWLQKNAATRVQVQRSE